MGYAALPDNSCSDSVCDIAVGDKVQWECDGELMFARPLQVVAVSNDGGYVYVQGRCEPLPRAQVTAVMSSASVVPTTDTDTVMRQDTFMLKEGMVLMQYPACLTAQSFEDLTDWLLLQHRKIGRFVNSHDKPALTRVNTES